MRIKSSGLIALICTLISISWLFFKKELTLSTISDALFLWALFFLIIGGFLWVFASGFFDHFQYSMKKAFPRIKPITLNSPMLVNKATAFGYGQEFFTATFFALFINQYSFNLVTYRFVSFVGLPFCFRKKKPAETVFKRRFPYVTNSEALSILEKQQLLHFCYACYSSYSSIIVILYPVTVPAARHSSGYSIDVHL